MNSLKEETKAEILVIEGDSIAAGALRRCLTRADYVVTVANDQNEAVALLRLRRFDLVLLDLAIKARDGNAIVAAIRHDFSRQALPILVIAASKDDRPVRQAMIDGANEQVIVPVKFSNFLEIVETQLYGPKRVAPGEATATESRRTALAVTKSSDEPDGVLGPLERDAAFDEDALLGRVVNNAYRLEKVIGKGGFSVVYRAERLSDDSPVAVKVLPPEYARRNRDKELIQAEAEAALRIEHPNAVTVYDVNVVSEKLPYIVMELLEGHTLADELTRNKRLSPQRCAEILIPVCDALSKAHRVGVVHRDLKPGNIFLHQVGSTEQVKVLDFGTARIGEETDFEFRNTVGKITGTPEYVAPERLQDEPFGGAVDVYSLGVILFKMISGRVPYRSDDGDFLSVAMQQLRGDPPSLRQCYDAAPSELESIVAAALKLDPAERCSLLDLASGCSEVGGVPLDASCFPHLFQQLEQDSS